MQSIWLGRHVNLIYFYKVTFSNSLNVNNEWWKDLKILHFCEDAKMSDKWSSLPTLIIVGPITLWDKKPLSLSEMVLCLCQQPSALAHNIFVEVTNYEGTIMRGQSDNQCEDQCSTCSTCSSNINNRDAFKISVEYRYRDEG